MMLDHPKSKQHIESFFPPVKCTYPMSSFWRLPKNKRWSFDAFCPLFWRLSFRVLKLFFFRKNSSHTDVCCLKQPAELFQRPSNRQHFPPWTLKKRTKAPRNASCLPTQADKRSPSQDPSADRWGASILFSPQTSLIYPCKTSLLHGLQDFLHILLVCLGLVKRQVGSPSFLAKSRNQKNSY